MHKKGAQWPTETKYFDGLSEISFDLLGNAIRLPLMGKKGLMPPLGLITIAALTRRPITRSD